MKTICLVEAIEAARDNWDFVLSLVNEDEMETVDPLTGWTVKDQMAHIAWHELETVELVESRSLAGSPWWELPTDERNRKICEQYENVPLEAVRLMAEDAYTRMLQALKELPDEDLNDPSRFENMPSDWTPWKLIASNTYQHYLEHALGIRRMLRTRRT